MVAPTFGIVNFERFLRVAPVKVSSPLTVYGLHDAFMELIVTLGESVNCE